MCSEEQNPGVVVSLRSCRAAGSEAELQAGRSAAALPPSGAPYSGVPGLDWGLRGDGAPEPPIGSSQLSSGTAKPPRTKAGGSSAPQNAMNSLCSQAQARLRAPLQPKQPGCGRTHRDAGRAAGPKPGSSIEAAFHQHRGAGGVHGAHGVIGHGDGGADGTHGHGLGHGQEDRSARVRRGHGGDGGGPQRHEAGPVKLQKNKIIIKKNNKKATQAGSGLEDSPHPLRTQSKP